MSSIFRSVPIFAALALLSPLSSTHGAAKSDGPDPYYTVPTYFFPKPDSRGAAWRVPNFGPVGVGINLEKPNFTMRITKVEKGSPADKTGKIKIGQIIESVNGKVMKDQDPRILLADWITEAEATDGKMLLKIKGAGDVLVQIPVMGRYSPTWPENCAKSDKVVRNLADLLAKRESPDWGSVMFLLSTGEEKDLDVVRKWMKNLKTVGPYPWHKGYNGPGLCEYYLRTGDKAILPVIKQMCEEIKQYWYNEAGWSGRGNAAFDYGQLNAAGVHCLNFLLMAKLCGVDVDDNMLQKSLRHFYRYAGHGLLAYGNDMPNGGFRDNGKVGGLAVTMGSAALLTPDGEKSVYAKARDSSSMKSFYATNWFHAAHTGGGLGEIWHNVTVCMMKDKRPEPYRSYLDTRRWVMDLSRRWDGGIGIAGVDDRYDKATGEQEIAWGNFFALTYTIHRKKLQMFGAPKSPYAVPFPLPERPWGNEADDAFQDPDPLQHPSITLNDLLQEKVETDSSAPAMSNWKNIKTDDGFLKYLHHPEHEFRSAMALRLASKNRADLILTMLKSPDPRGRECGLVALIGDKKSEPLAAESLTPEMKDLVEKMYTDPAESWWVKINAMYAMKRWGSELAAKHKASLVKYLEHEDWWFQYAALQALGPIATSPQHAEDIIPPMADLFGRTRIGRILIFSRDFEKSISKADKQVQALAMPYFKKAFDAVPREFIDPTTGYVMGGGAHYARNKLATILVNLPGGIEIGRTDPKITLKSAISGKDGDMYVFSGTYTPDKTMAGKWLKKIEIMPGKLGALEEAIAKEDAALAKMDESFKKKQANKAANPNAKKKKRKAKSPLEQKTYLELLADGRVGTSKLLFWTDDMLVDNRSGEARRMMLHTSNGKTYLLVEKGGFIPVAADKEDGEGDADTGEADTTPPDDGSSSETRPAGWHCGYQVYERTGP
jgi:hypothetical protein